jgi:hypothetical protein
VNVTAFPPPTGRRIPGSPTDVRYVKAYAALEAREARVTTAKKPETRAKHWTAFVAAGGCPTCAAQPSQPCMAWNQDGTPRVVSYRHDTRTAV